MHPHFVPYLVDPTTHEPFDITTLAKDDTGRITAGLLTTKKTWYPIINAVPRILIGDLKQTCLQTHYDFFAQWQKKLPARVAREWQSAIDMIEHDDAFFRHQKKTAESFAYEWKYIYKENDYEKNNFLHFLSPFLDQGDLKGKATLDIGCGSGRFTKWAALSGAKVAFGTDLGETVEVAYGLTKDLPNVCIVQADIYAMPFRGAFDIAYSIGVLHHLPKPQAGFASLPVVLRKNGTMLIWVYNRRHNARAIYLYEPMRAVLKQLPKPVVFRLSYLPALAVQVCNELTVGLQKAGAGGLAKKMPFAYYANFPFSMKLNDAFDVLATPKSNYYLKEEVEAWFRESGLKKVQSFEHPEAGITCIGSV